MVTLRSTVAVLMLFAFFANINEVNAGGDCHRRSTYQRSYHGRSSHPARYSRQSSNQRSPLFSQRQRSQRGNRTPVYGSDYVGQFPDSNFNGSVDAFEPNYGGLPGLFW